MLTLQGIHHIAIICSDYQKSKEFYTTILGFKIIQEVYREDRKSYKLDLSLNEIYTVELFSFPDAINRPSYPEACGLRHLAFKVEDLDKALKVLKSLNIACEDIRVDPYTHKRFSFFSDPDGLPLELYEI